MKNLQTSLPKINGSKLKISIVLPYFHDQLGQQLLSNCLEELKVNQVSEKKIKVIRVAGAFEIPYACQITAKKDKPDAIIALGIIIKGATPHFELIAESCHQGLMQVQLTTGVPISAAVLTCNNLKQVQERVAKNKLNKGKEAAQAALIQSQLTK